MQSPGEQPVRSSLPGLVVEHFDEMDSTSLHARRLIETGAAAITSPRLIVAEIQSAGRGQRGRTWASPTGGLWCTFLIPWTEPLCKGELSGRTVATLGVRLGLACLRTIKDALDPVAGRPTTAMLKLPNDIYIDSRKLLGILTEIVTIGSAAQQAQDRPTSFLLVGVGVNANVDLSRLPPEIAQSAVSLRDVLGQDVDRLSLRRLLACEILSVLSTQALSQEELAEVAASLYAKGAAVRVMSSDGEPVTGSLKGVDEQAKVVVNVGGRLVSGVLA